MEIRLLLVPYDSGQRNVRMGAGPEHLRAAGLEKHLTDQGHRVESVAYTQLTPPPNTVCVDRRGTQCHRTTRQIWK